MAHRQPSTNRRRASLLSDSIHRTLARRIAGWLVAVTLPPGIRKDAPGGITDYHADDPNWLYLYIYAVIAAWCVLAVTFGLLMIALAYLGDRVDGGAGRNVGIGIGAGLAFFCVAGGAVATWHSFFAYAARRRYRRSGQVDVTSRRNMRLAQLHNSSLIIQSAVGVAVGFLVATGAL